MQPLRPLPPFTADDVYDRIQQHTCLVEAELQEDQELVVTYADPGGERLRVTDMGFMNPNLILLWGIVDEREVSVLVSMEALRLTFTTATVAGEQKRRRIGFRPEIRAEH